MDENKIEETYRLLYRAVATKAPVKAIYKGRRRLFCPHRLGRNKQGDLRVLCYQYGGESESGLEKAGSLDNWRCVALDKLSAIQLLLEERWRTASNHSLPASCIAESDIDADDPPVKRLRAAASVT